MDAPRRYDLPVTGMSCAACAVRLEKVLNRLPGVSAQVNFATGKARLSAGPEAADGDAVLAAIRKAGFDVAPQVLELGIGGMSCAACAARIEKVVRRLPGVEGSVNFAAETARVRYMPGLADPAAIVAAIARAGFTATPSGAKPANTPTSWPTLAGSASTAPTICRFARSARYRVALLPIGPSPI